METVKYNGFYLVDFLAKPHNRHFTGIVENNKGSVGWFKNGKAHKEDGPAITYDSPLLHDVWCLNGISYPKNQWQEEIVKIKMRRILDS